MINKLEIIGGFIMNKKKILSVLIAAAMIAGSFTAVSYAETQTAVMMETEEWNGEAIKEPEIKYNVYQIGTAEELAWFAAKVNGTNGLEADDTISAALTGDIDLNGKNFTPIGTGENGFNGNFDGYNFVISNGKVNSDIENAGLFAKLGGNGRIEYLAVKGITAETTEKTVNIGILAGLSDGHIRNVDVAESTVIGSDKSYAGGIVGKAENDTLIEKVSFGGNVEKSLISGGFAGIFTGGTIRDSYAKANIKSPDDKSLATINGGLVGEIDMSSHDTLVTNCFAMGEIYIKGLTASETGGLIGNVKGKESDNFKAYVTRNYAVVKIDSDITLHIGNLYGTVSDSFIPDFNYFNEDINSFNAVVGNKLNIFGEEGPANLILNNNSLTSEQMKSVDFIKNPSLTDGNKIGNGFVFAEGENDGYPVIDAMQYKQTPEFIEIQNAIEFNEIAENINNGERYNKDTFYSDINYKLNKNISFKDADNNYIKYSPIGTKERPFTGDFDFNGFVIGYVNVTTENAALFDYTYNSKIINPKIANSVFGGENTKIASAVVLNAVNTEITDAIVDSNVSVRAKDYAAGIAVNAKDSKITGCTNRAEITSEKNAAGIVGAMSNGSDLNGNTNDGKVTGVEKVGGIVSDIKDTTITLCNNNGEITGGIVGGIAADAKNSIITKCSGKGKINASEIAGGIYAKAEFTLPGRDENTKTADSISIIKNSNNGDIVNTSEKDGYTGGIIGKVISEMPIDISYNYNVSNITSNTMTGGLIGRIETKNNQTSTVRRSYFAGKITGDNAGTILGETEGKSTLYRVYFDRTLEENKEFVKKSDNVTIDETAASLESDNMKNKKAFTDLLSSTGVFTYNADETANNSYPILNVSIDTSGDNDESEDDSLIQDEDGYYMIKNAAQLKKAAALSDTEFSSKKYRLMNDIDLGAEWNESGELTKGEAWKTIGFSTGDKNESYSFKGEFDGMGHTVTNVYVDGSSSFGGFFGSADGAVIKNLNIDNIYIKAQNKTGGLCGSITNAASIENCKVNNAVVNGTEDVGGLVGFADKKSSIKNCEIAADINASELATGGVVGTSDNITIDNIQCKSNIINKNNKYVGGIAGYAKNVNISNINIIQTDISGKDSAGGIIGYCVDNSDIENVKIYEMTINAGIGCGGIIGEVNSSNKADIDIGNVFVDYSSIKAEDSIGGIIGDVSVFKGDININDISVSKINVYALKNDSKIGGIIGYNRAKSNNNLTVNHSFVNGYFLSSEDINKPDYIESYNDETSPIGAFIGLLEMQDEDTSEYKINNSYFIGSGAYKLYDDSEQEYAIDLSGTYMISGNDKITVKNHTGKTIKADAVLAKFNQSGGVDKAVTVPVETAEVSAEIETNNDAPANLFVWESINNMRPLTFMGGDKE